MTAKPRLTAMLRLTGTFRRGWLVVLGSLLGLIAVLLAATPASAHAVLVRTNPTQGSVVDQPPAQVVLTFSESVRAVPGKVRVIAPDGSRADSDAASTSGNQLIIGMRPDGGPGTYLVTFRVLSADSHPVAGTFTYSVGAPSTPPSADAAVAEASGFVTAALPVTRWVGYVGLLLVVGAVLVLGLLWPRRLDRRGPARVLWLGVVLAGVATVAELLLQVPYVAGGGLGAIDAAGLREVLATQFGAAHVIRLGVLAAAVLLLRPISQGRGWGADRVLLAVLGAIAVATWSVSGHPSGSSVPMVSIVADMIHLSAMSVWVGGLVMLVAFLLVQANGPELAAIVPVWSRWATYAVGALVVTGLVQAVVNVGTPGALVSTTYGWRLIIKVGLVAAVLVVALLTRRLVGPVTGQADGAARRLRILVGVEALVAAAVLATTSVLVQTTPARTAAAEA
ncbi:MAG TPA: copper resistance protein CopC, partial [Micromonosporaceae bacterium]